MTIAQLISELSNFPDDLEVNFRCPDGYEDNVNAVFLNDNAVALIGELVYHDWFPKLYPNIKVYE